MSDITEPAIAWLAGFTDGEGCVSVNRPYGCPRPIFQLRNTHYQSMVRAHELIQKIIGKEVRLVHETRARGQDNWRVHVTSQATLLDLASVVEPYSVTKRRHWQLAIAFLELRMQHPVRGKGKTSFTDEELSLADQLQALNRRWDPTYRSGTAEAPGTWVA